MKTIRLAGSDDLSIIRELAQQIWPVAYGDILAPSQLTYMLDKFYSIDSLRQQLLDAHHRFILISDVDRPVGFASYSCKKDHSHTCRVHKIYVLPEQQGKGTGKMLLAYIIGDSKETGANSLELNVNRHNKARYFYEKQGFIVKKTEDIDIGAGYFMNDYVMELLFQ
jgi:GNAT superfamily N-acetyltransferase